MATMEGADSSAQHVSHHAGRPNMDDPDGIGTRSVKAVTSLPPWRVVCCQGRHQSRSLLLRLHKQHVWIERPWSLVSLRTLPSNLLSYFFVPGFP